MYEELRDKLDYDLFYLKRGNNSFRLESTIYHTRDEHANHYITNTVDLYLTNMLRWIPIVLPYWNISPQVDMLLHMDTLYPFQANQPCFMLSGEAANTYSNFIVFDLNWIHDLPCSRQAQ